MNIFFIEFGAGPTGLLFATEGPDIYPDQHNVAALIIEAIKRNRIPNSQLLIRLHPHDSMSKYENLKNYSNVKIEYPYEKTNNNGVGLNFAFGKQKRNHLANSLYHSDVVISVASTIAIEACIFQKPIIDIGFECDNEMQIVNSSKEIYSLTHYNNFTNFGANDIAFSRYELIDLINENLKFPDQKQKNRSDAMKAFAKNIDGQSMVRSIDALQSFLKIEKNSNG